MQHQQVAALSTRNQNNNFCMPLVGLGTWKALDEEIEKAVEDAINIGYRHIDTAFNYNNEEAIGKALKKLIDSGVVNREELFITTKLPVFGNRAKDVERFLKMSLERLNLNYIDLYLIHMPFSIKLDEKTMGSATCPDGSVDLDLENDNLQTWKVMEEQVKKGLVKYIGLSNFNQIQIKDLYQSSEIKPSALQVELHAYLQQPQLIELCKELHITPIAYAPLGSAASQNHFQTKYNYFEAPQFDLLNDQLIKEIASKYGKTSAQILLRHLVQKGVCVIPKSTNCTRMLENISLWDFELSAEDMDRLNSLDRGEKGRIFSFLFFKGITQHPNYPFN